MCPLFHTSKSWIVFFIIPVTKTHLHETCCGAREGGIEESLMEILLP